MRLVSDGNVEFRRVNEVSKNDGKVNFYYTFEDDFCSFQLFSRERFNLKKGDNCRLVFETRVWNGSVNFDLKEVVTDGK